MHSHHRKRFKNILRGDHPQKATLKDIIDINFDFTVERGSGEDVVFYWYHRQFIEAAQERYLTAENVSLQERTTVHQNIAEYFIGKWHGNFICIRHTLNILLILKYLCVILVFF